MNTMTLNSVTTPATTLSFKPINLARWIIWGGFALILIVLPHLFKAGFALTLLCQIGTIMIFSLSFNMLLGQAGMLSFGHAVYSGLGAYIAIHTLNICLLYTSDAADE